MNQDYGKSSGGRGGVKGGSPYGGKGSGKSKSKEDEPVEGKGKGKEDEPVKGDGKGTEDEPVKGNGKGKGKTKERGLLWATYQHLRILRTQVAELEEGLELWFRQHAS